MASQQLSSFLHNPGIFYTDNPYAFPHEPLVSELDGLSYAPFHCHIARDAKADITKNLTAAHIIYGESQAIELGLHGVDATNKMNIIAGHGNLFTSYRGPRRQSEAHDLGKDVEDGDPFSVDYPIFMTDNIEARPQGAFLGRKTLDEIYNDDKDDVGSMSQFWNSKARWCSPVGVQFRWSSRGSKQASSALNMTKLTLIYMDNWFPGRTLYMPLVESYEDKELSSSAGINQYMEYGRFVNDRSYYQGSDPFTDVTASAASGPDRHPHGKYGEVVAYAQPEVREYMASSYTRAVCIGMYIEFYNRHSPATYDRAKEIFDFKFLFDMPDEKGNMSASNSMFIYPAPYPLKDAFDSNNIKLL